MCRLPKQARSVHTLRLGPRRGDPDRQRRDRGRVSPPDQEPHGHQRGTLEPRRCRGLRLRALHRSGDFDDYWTFHEAQEAKRNHASLFTVSLMFTTIGVQAELGESSQKSRTQSLSEHPPENPSLPTWREREVPAERQTRSPGIDRDDRDDLVVGDPKRQLDKEPEAAMLRVNVSNLEHDPER